jgi:predicted Zn-dependent protease
MGVSGSKGSLSGNYATDRADLLVLVGSRGVCQADCSGTAYASAHAVININADLSDATHYNRSVVLPGDIGVVIEQLLDSLAKAGGADPSRAAPWLAECLAKKREWEAFKAERYRHPSLHDALWGRPVLTQPAAIKVASDFANAIGAVKFFDAGDVQAAGFQVAEDDTPHQTVTETGASYMGFAVSALLAVVALSRTVVVELKVAEVFPAGAPRLARAPAPDALRTLTRRMDRFYPFAGQAPPPPGEPGRTEGFLEYIAGDPRLAEGERRRLYLQPIGPFSPGQRRGLRLGAAFLARYFCLPVATAEPLPLSEIPDEGRRVHAEWGIPQLQSTTLIHELLRARLPRDAAGLLAVTAVDLWPGEGWHAVRGQASLVARVGIVSLYRSGLADRDEGSFRLFLRRTLKLMVHEVGHIFSMRHCPLEGCVMSGQNDSDLSDRRHPLLCPECLAKLVWATRCDPVERARALARFCREHELYEEAALFKVLGDALRGW